jgi:signal transduction histidine kinase/Tfp pilus assembly protein PilF
MLILPLCATIAQDNHVSDSLTAVLNTTITDSTRVNILNKLGRIYRSKDEAKARAYIGDAIRTGQHINYYSGLTESYNVLAMINEYAGDYKTAKQYYHKAIAISPKAGDELRTARLLDNLGGLFHRMNEYDSANTLFYKSLRIKEKYDDKKGIALSYDQLGVIQTTIGHYPAALRLHLKSLAIKEKLPDNREISGTSYLYIAITYNEIEKYEEAYTYYTKALEIRKGSDRTEELISIYLNRGNVLANLGRYDEALEDNLSALGILKQYSNVAALASCYNSMAYIYKQKNDDKAAMRCYDLALPLARQLNDEYLMATINNSLGELAGKAHQFPVALKYLEEGYQLALHAGILEYLKENYLIRSQVAAAMNDHKQAYAFYKLYGTIKDSLLNETNNRQIAEMKERYEADKKAREIMLLNSRQERQAIIIQKRNTQLVAFAGAFLLCIIIVGLAVNRNNIKQAAKLKIAIADNERIRVQTILETEQQERKRIAKDLHDELGSGISQIVLCNELAKKHINGNESLNKTLHTIDRTVTELAADMNGLIWALQVEHASVDYLFARMREFASDFFENSSIEPKLDLEQIVEVIPISKALMKDVFLVYKEALNNAMKYSQGSVLHVSARLDYEMIIIHISDNGIGIEQNGRNKMGNGIRNMRNRIEKHGGTISISGVKNGTVIDLSVNYNSQIA